MSAIAAASGLGDASKRATPATAPQTREDPTSTRVEAARGDVQAARRLSTTRQQNATSQPVLQAAPARPAGAQSPIAPAGSTAIGQTVDRLA
jgi:hypothetical protein